MKLLHQLNLAFGFLLIVVLGTSALLIYSILLQLLISDQRTELKDKGLEWLTRIEEKGGSFTQQDIDQLLKIPTRGGKLEVMLLEKNKVQYTTLPSNTLDKWLEKIKESRKKKSKPIFEEDRDQYIVEYVTLDRGENNKKLLVLATPLRGIKIVRYMLAKQMFIILSLGGVVALLLSYVMTQMLVKPLTKVRQELLKIKDRRYDDVEWVSASGEIGEVAQSVHQLAMELDRYNRTQKQFFQNGSHELKTPLMSIQGYAEGIRDGIFTGDAATRGLNVIISESERLKKIVTEMTLLAKLESEEGIYHIEPIDIHGLLDQLLERLSPIWSKQNIQFTIDNQLEVSRITEFLGDKEKVMQAFINIVSNAIRYARREIKITVRVEEQWAVFDVLDDGEGIPEELLPHLFQRFVKGKDGGTGLGLAISRAIIERCHGKIKVQNSPSGGAVFSLYFPFKNN
ncbi:MAG TPA: HAMP domain-containing sensor histidine kinase [Bacillota bacterium]|nr:HAMP domain-containing sensor histidine kinase [Bacillota bacterium]